MKPLSGVLTVLLLACSGCAPQVAVDAENLNNVPAPSVDPLDTQIALTPENTKVQFVGTHAAADPNPRTGVFEQFSGTATIDGSALTSLEVEIQTDSLSTDIEKLTNHLKSPDFFSVNEHPTATFQSTSISAGDDGKTNITGDLTLLGVTKSITFPAEISTADGLSLKSEFTIDRTEFGMDFGLQQVEKEVAMTVTVGQ